MARLALLSVAMRELVTQTTRQREPEPELMLDHEQVRAYAHAGRVDGPLAAAYVFNSAHVTRTLYGARRVVDLGCGPATQLAQVAALNPDSHFLGVDLSDTMLERASDRITGLGLQNVELAKDDISTLASVPSASADAVFSTVALHHLPTLGHLESCFKSIARVLKPGGALYLADFIRFKSLQSIMTMAYNTNSAAEPAVYKLDFERSMRAAFSRADFANLARSYLPATTRIYEPVIPMFTMIRTPSRTLPGAVISSIHQLARELPPRYRRELNEFRTAYRLRGLRDDPFTEA